VLGFEFFDCCGGELPAIGGVGVMIRHDRRRLTKNGGYGSGIAAGFGE